MGSNNFQQFDAPAIDAIHRKHSSYDLFQLGFVDANIICRMQHLEPDWEEGSYTVSYEDAFVVPCNWIAS